MRIERLSVGNLRDGVFCARGRKHGEEMYSQMEAWLEGDLLRGQIARTENGDPAGFILYYPIERAPLDVEGEGLYMVQCLFVKPEEQNKGIGRALIESAVVDAQETGASGLAVEGFREQRQGAFSYLPGTFLQHLGMESAESRGPGTLYYVALRDGVQSPRYLDPTFEPEEDVAKVRIDILDCSKCYVGISNRELVKAVLDRSGPEDVSLTVHDQNSREAILDKGMSSGIFLDGRLTFFQGPVSEDDVWNAIAVARTARKRATDR